MKKEMLNGLIELSKNVEGQVFSSGECKVLRAYYDSTVRGKKDEIVFSNMNGFFESELKDALYLMDETEINSFITFDNSSSLIHTIHFF